LAVCAAVFNALSSVLQRKAARDAPSSDAFKLALIWNLVRNPVWLGGIAALTGGFILQALALSFGGLAIVQPIFVLELPLTMIFVGSIFHTRLDVRSWTAVLMVTVGLAMLLAAANPSEGHETPSAFDWIVTGAATAGAMAVMVAIAVARNGPARAATLGVATGFGFAFTAAVMKQATTEMKAGPVTLFTTWPIYVMVGTGLLSLYLLQNALQSGSLVVAQPAVTISDPVASMIFGAMLFGENIRQGPFIVPEVFGVALITVGSIRLAASAPIQGQQSSSDVTTTAPHPA
jgi:drug/metabolite transporter (DMT)-like permease